MFEAFVTVKFAPLLDAPFANTVTVIVPVVTPWGTKALI